jgi:hypothetical protein
MTDSTQKLLRLSGEGRFFLTTCRAATGFNDSRIVELCLALHALSLGIEVRRANEFLYANLVQSLNDVRLLKARKYGQARRNRLSAIIRK